MTSRKELSELTLRFQARTLNIYRKLFFDLQEREYSVELRDRAAKLAKAIKDEDYPEAKSQADNITYLFKLCFQANLILPTVYQGLAVDGLTLSATIEEAINGEIGPDPEPEIIPVEKIPEAVRKYIPGGEK
ncbi:MAG: hypothetical protein IJA05_05120 [Oscillospiraceae bacterium]|nr:hypothetical protein [Oscillospiraceae bacterium]